MKRESRPGSILAIVSILSIQGVFHQDQAVPENQDRLARAGTMPMETRNDTTPRSYIIVLG